MKAAHTLTVAHDHLERRGVRSCRHATGQVHERESTHRSLPCHNAMNRHFNIIEGARSGDRFELAAEGCMRQRQHFARQVKGTT